MSARRLFLVAIALAVLWFGYRRLFPDDESQIRTTLDRIADAVGNAAGSEGEVARLARAASVRNYLDPQVVVDAGPPFSRIGGRDALIGTIARFRGSVGDLEVSFEDVQIEVDPGGEAAQAHLTAEARYRDGTGARGLDARELDVAFLKRGGDWVVSRVTLVKTLESLTPR